ncbi:hypothetical protein HBH51_103200 [Parastagonospora nodorum]|nr:hypothetical protein HBH51_103200 [Parastagonospora nodorum]
MSVGASAGEGAKKLGEKLMAEVEVEDLSSVLKSLRELRVAPNETPNTHIFFGIPEIDILFPSSTSPILELISPPPTHHPSGAGKTSLLYLIIAHAILPTTFSSTPLSGQNAAVILFDPLHHFSVPRLAKVIFTIISTTLHSAAKEIEPLKPAIKTLIATSLLHVHIFRPQSWSATLSTLKSMPDYLFDEERHKSKHRRIHSIVLEDVDAFVWSIRSSVSTDLTATPESNLTSASTLLTSALMQLHTQFSCGVILTSHSTTPSSFRPAIPTSWPKEVSTTRLAVRRVEVLKFAPALSVEEAEIERAQRWDVVKKGRFEVWEIGAGVGAGNGEGFVFRIGDEGVGIERNEK